MGHTDGQTYHVAGVWPIEPAGTGGGGLDGDCLAPQPTLSLLPGQSVPHFSTQLG